MSAQRLPAGVVASSPARFPVLFDGSGRPVSVITPEGTYPFPSGQPMAPALAEGTPPRAFIPSPYQNLAQTPRTQPGLSLTPFESLRALADYDLVRIVIATLKGTVKGQVFEIVPRQEFEEEAYVDEDIDKARRWMEVPDPYGRIEWDDWLDLLLEETLVTDALSVLPRHTKGGQFVGLEIIDGATIKPLVDDRGKPPLPPSPAYQQIAYGRAETNQFGPRVFEPEREFFSRKQGMADNELWYLPRNRRARTLFGQSEVERVMMTVNQAIRNSVHELSYYTTGNLPDSLFAVPETWNRQMISEFQQDFDDILSGRTDRRSGNLRFVPDGTYIPTKTQEWQYEYVEFLSRVIAWAFSVSALPIMKQVGRNPSEVLQSTAVAAGVKPLTNFVCRVINRAFRDEMNLPRVMLRISNEEAEAPEVVYQRNIAYACNGIVTWNQARKAAGEDPYPEPWADRPMLVQGTTVVFLDDIEAKIKRDEEQAKALAASLGNAGSGDEADPSHPGNENEDAKPAPPEPATDAQKALQGFAKAVRDELAQARRYALKRAAKGKAPLEGFVFHVVPLAIQKRVKDALAVAA